MFAGVVRTMTDCKCFSVAFKLGHFDFRRLLLAFQGDAIADAETHDFQPARVKSANTDFDPVFSWMLFLMVEQGLDFLAD